MVQASWERQVLLGLKEWVVFGEEEKGEEVNVVPSKS